MVVGHNKTSVSYSSLPFENGWSGFFSVCGAGFCAKAFLLSDIFPKKIDVNMLAICLSG